MSAQDDAASESHSVNTGELRSFVERYERLEMDKRATMDAQKDLLQSAKSSGYDVKILKRVIALRARDKDDVAEEEAVEAMYRAALGLD